MKKFLIILDLDNTLLDSKKRISNYTSKVLKQIKSMNNAEVKIVLNTSRSYDRTRQYIKDSYADYINCFNGNLLIDSNKNVLFENSISNKIVKNLIINLANMTKNIIVETKYTSFCLTEEDAIFFDSNISNIEFLKNLSAIKILCKINEMYSDDLKDYADHYKLDIIKCRETGYYRIVPVGIDKWITLKSYINTNEYKTISFGDDITDLETLQNSYIGVKMKNSHFSLESIKFTASDNNDNGVAKFLNDYFSLDLLKDNNSNLKILDCSLRDGGHLNKSNFGKKTIKNFVNNLINSNVDIIELGFLQDCVYNEDCAIYPSVDLAEYFLKDIDSKKTTFSLLTQVDKFDIKNLTPRKGKISLLRVSFHKWYLKEAINYCSKIMKNGYQCAINPINFSSYSTDDIVELIKEVNKLKPNIFSIVDTFGMYASTEFSSKVSLLKQLLDNDITLGLHLHDNLSLAFSAAQSFINSTINYKNVIIDTSICGLGRAPGNLKTELLMYYTNKYILKKEKYNLNYIYKIIANEINNLSKNLDWNFNFVYAITAFERMHRTYGEYYLNKNLTLKEIEILLKNIPKENKNKFDETVAEHVYNDFYKHWRD